MARMNWDRVDREKNLGQPVEDEHEWLVRAAEREAAGLPPSEDDNDGEIVERPAGSTTSSTP
jgi:hypothetical protein